MDGKCDFSTDHILPETSDKSLKRLIEMDNKALLYTFAKSIRFDKKYDVLIPGYGAILIVPFMKAIHGFEYTNLLKSKYAKDKNQKDVMSDDITCSLSNPNILSKENNILLLDDNVGTGETIKDIKLKLQEKGVNCYCGGIQYNWINYHRYTLGEKDIRFNISDFDMVTPFNYPGHKLLDHSIEYLKKSGKSYIKYIKSKDYRKNNMTDMQSLIERGERYTEKEHLNLYNNSHNKEKLKDTAIKTNIQIKRNVELLSLPEAPKAEKVFDFPVILSLEDKSLSNSFSKSLISRIQPIEDQLVAYGTNDKSKKRSVEFKDKDLNL